MLNFELISYYLNLYFIAMNTINEIHANVVYDDPWSKEIRKGAIFFFVLAIVLVFVSHYLSVRFEPEDYAQARSTFLNGRMDSLDLIFFNIAVPCVYFGWTTISKVLNRILGPRYFQGSIAIIIIYYFARFIASFFLGFILLPILVIFNLVKLLFARRLANNRIVQYFS